MGNKSKALNRTIASSKLRYAEVGSFALDGKRSVDGDYKRVPFHGTISPVSVKLSCRILNNIASASLKSSAPTDVVEVPCEVRALEARSRNNAAL